ncbi:DUF805 domain-containing protein [Flavobacterium ginsenosidimutans]|uniref:DUF805 domain-containing protein n=1 Tax=Flavobacterium ginsenosidimutans TaxID=687844 RepID=A0ABZ2Q6Y3_9FLAO
MKLKNLIFFYSSFTEKSGRIEFALYFAFNIIASYFAIELWKNVNLNDIRILNIFYTCLILLITFVPTQAVITRRLRDLNTSPIFIVFNFIPILNFAFWIFLLLAKKKS